MAYVLLSKLMVLTVVLSVALGVVLLLRLPLRTWLGPGLAYAIWGLVPAALCTALLPARLAPTTVLPLPIAANLPAIGRALAPAPEQSWPLIAVLFWLSGALVLALYFWRQHRAFMARLGCLTDRYGIHYAESAACGPALIGIWHPRIVVPADFELRYAVEQQKLIVAHERTHLQRADVGTNLSCAFLQCVFWFHPLFHVASRAFRFDQELACDAAVMRQHPYSRQAYADAMLKTQLVTNGTAAGCYWQFNHPLKERVMNLKRNAPSLVNRIAGSLLIVAVAGGGAYGAWAAQAPQALQTAPAGAKTYRLAIDLQDKYGNTRPIVETHEGEEAAVAHGEGSKQMSYSFTVNPAQAGSVRVSLITRMGETIINAPRLVVGLGQTGTLETKSDPAEDSDYTIKLTVTDATPAK